MAQGRDNGTLVHVSDELWAKACAEAGYAIKDGKPVLGISGDEGDGFLVTLDPPNGISPVNLARALCSYALRVGQSVVKAAEKDDDSEPSQELAQAGTNSALLDYKPARNRSENNDILTTEAELQFYQHVARLVSAAKPGATPDDVRITYEAEKAKPSGLEWIAKKKEEIWASGRYTVNRRKGSTKGAAVEISI